MANGPSEPNISADPNELAAAALVAIFASDDGLADPTPYFHQLREAAPVFAGSNGTVLTRFGDCRTLLGDNRFGNGQRQPSSLMADDDAVAARREILAKRRDQPSSMLFLDPPEHTRQRALVSRAFTPRRMEALRSRIRELVDHHLDRMAESGGGDLMEMVAMPFPVNVISEMLGVPDQDWPDMREQVNLATLGLEPTATADELWAGDAASQWMRAYFTDLLDQRRGGDGDDLLSALIQAREADDQLSEGEIMVVAQLLFAAGSETTTNLIGNGMNALLNHPDQMEALWADPSLVPSAVEEMLRFDSPVQVDGRVCLEPADLFGHSFSVGDRVTTLLGAANHDPDQFSDPDRFDITRHSPSILSFGHGIHHCLGANLARVEGQEFFAALVDRFDPPQPAGPRPYRRRIVLRGLERCPIALSPR